MDSLNLKVTDPNAILSLIEELCDLSYIEIQLKLNTYIQAKTGTKIYFLAPILYERKEIVIHVIGNKVLDHELRLPISSIFNLVINCQKTIMITSSELPKELLQYIYLDRHCIQVPFFLIPVQHHLKQLTALVVCLSGCENKNIDIDTCTKVVLDCFRYCLGYILSSLRCYEETRLKHQCQSILAISRKLITHLGDLTDLLHEIMTEVKKLTNAERCSLFLLENDQQELVAYVFDGISTKKFVKEMRISVNKGIAGHVATTGKLLNIQDTYKHPLFYRGIDEATGFKTKNILCFPIHDENGIVGVAQLCNKIDGLYFDELDEEIATAVSIYCGITIMHSIVYKKMQDAQARNKLSNEIMMYHMKVEDEAVFDLVNYKIKNNIIDFNKFYFSPRDISYEDMPSYIIKIFNDLNFIKYFKIKMHTLARFILYVKKGYRNASYHNWVHAFSVAHFAYLLIKNLYLIREDYMTYLQAFVFLVSCLCHDIDHRGTNNAFQTTSESVLASLYSSEGSVMERHHFAQTMCILNTEGCNIFENFNSQEYREALVFLKNNILATDLASHFLNTEKQNEIFRTGYKKHDFEHQKLLSGMLMTCCDLSDQTKNWTVTKKVAELIYEEFFSQGDLEKSMGRTPTEMMDRDKAFIPDLQVQFITDIVEPLFNNLAMLFPMAQPLVKILKYNKTLWEASKKACTQLQLIIDPYKCDNARLVQECNQLHLDLIETEETYQKQIKDLKKQVYKLECECNDLQLVSSRNLQKIKDLETESAKKSKKILDLQGKCLKPIISNIGIGNKKRPCYPLRRPVIEAEPLPKTGSSNSTLPSTHAVEPKILDLLSMADHRMSCLSHEVTKLKGELSLQTDNVYTLQNQLTTKEKEIIRLKKLLEGGRPYSAVAKDCLCKKVDKMHVVSHDIDENNDLKILLQNKQELEQQLKEAVNKQHEAMSQAMKLAERNEELEKELRDIDHIALSVEADCNSAVKENNRRVYRLQEKLEDVMEQVHILESELAVKRREVQELTADLEACKLEKRNIQRTLESTLEEKKKITNKINQLTIIEKSLNDEIERLSKENECQKQDIIQLQYTNKVLKEQLDTEVACGDDLKQLREKGEKNDQNRGKKSMGNRTNVEDSECSSFSQEINIDREEYKSIYKEDEVNKLVNNDRTSDNMRKLIIEKDLQIDNLQQSIKQLENERDYYRNECNCLKQKDESSNKDNVELWTRSYELRCQLNEKEKIIFELQKEKNDLYHERKELEAYKNQQKKTCIPSGSCKIYKPISTCAHLSSTLPHDIHIETTKVMLDSLELERDTARADVQRLTEERDVLYERLKGTQRGTVHGYEDQLEDLQEELRRTKQELTVQRTQFFQLRALQDQTDQALGDVQGQLTQSETELNKAIDRNRNMEQQHLQLDDQVKELKQEINNLHSNMAHLDREKDQLLMVLDEKTEKIVNLERELIHKEQQANSMEQQMRDLQHKNEICVDQSAEYERQFRSLQLEVKNVQRQLETSNTDRENAIQENRRLQDDLAAVMCEVRNLQHELESCRAESYDLKRQLQTYVSEVRRAEEMLNRKENERTEMLNHFRSLSLEATVLENNNHSLESEAAEARGALQTARDRLIDLERQLVDKDCLIRGYETQISELTQNVASMETQLRQQTEQRQRAEADLSAVRDLCIKMDQQKDSLMQQLEDKDVTKTQYETQLVRLRTEQNVIQDQIDRDRATIERLETLLDQARQESIKVQTTNQELQNEMSRLKQKISELQTTLSAESLELRQYQNQAAEYSKQISELRRQVTNERFDRARKEEENRRSLNSTPDSFNVDLNVVI